TVPPTTPLKLRCPSGLFLFGARSLLAVGMIYLPLPASAKDCAAWNIWCRPACGDWNGYCAGQSLPTIIGRMAPQSFFADPWWYGQPQDWNTGERASPKPKPRPQARKAGKTKTCAKHAD